MQYIIYTTIEYVRERIDTAKKKTSRYRAFAIVLFSFLGAIVIPCLAVIGVAVASMNAVSSEVRRANTIAFQNTVQTIDGLFSDMLDISHRVIADSSIRISFINGTQNTWEERNISLFLSNAIIGNKCIESILLFLPDENKVITSNFSADANFYTQNKFGVDFSDFCAKILSIRNLAFVNFASGVQHNADFSYAFVHKASAGNPDSAAAVIIQLNKAQIDLILRQALLFEDSSIVIFDTDKILTATSPLPFAEDVVAEYQKSGALNSLITQDGTRYAVQYYRSPIMGLVYAQAIPQNRLEGTSLFTQQYIILLLSVTIFVTLIVCWLFARRNYVHIEKILLLLGDKPQSFQEENPYVAIEKSILDYIDENALLSDIVGKQSRQLRDSFLLKLMSDKIHYFENMQEIYAMHEIEFNSDFFCLILYEIPEDFYLFDDESIGQIEKNDLLRFIFDNVMSELCRDRGLGTCYCINDDDDFICIINCRDNEMATQEAIKEINEKLTAFQKEHFNLYTESTISSIYMGVKMLPKAYFQIHDIQTNKNRIEIESYSSSIQECIHIIQQQYQDNTLSVSEIANQLNLNPSYLSRYFKQQVGIGLLDYLHQYRLTIVKQLLKEERNKSINSIAAQTGFYTASTLIRVFKKHEGITPSQYREHN